MTNETRGVSELNKFQVTQEHYSLKDTINKISEKVTKLGGRQDGIDTQISKILLALEHNGMTEEASRTIQIEMVSSVKELTKTLGRIQIEMVRNEATALKMVDERLEDVYRQINNNRDRINSVKTETLKEYTTTNLLYKQIGAIYALVVIIAVMAWTNYQDNRNTTRLTIAKLENEHKVIAENIKSIIKEKSSSYKNRLEKIEISIKNHGHKQ